MEEFELGRWQDMSHLGWAIPAVLLACAWGIARRRRVLERFGLDSERFRAWLTRYNQRRWLRATTLAIALAFLTAAAVEPRVDPEKQPFRTEARDVAILLDISRSMLAEDIEPNRLERAKQEVEKLVDHLSGDRVGLVVFAGEAVVKCPLTSNYSYFKSALRNVSERSASQGGTRIGDAVRKTLSDLLGARSRAARVASAASSDTGGEDDDSAAGETIAADDLREEEPERHADILLITDGEDHESYPVRAARQAGAADVGIYVIGLGNPEGTPIPITDESGVQRFLEYRGERVLSKLDAETLQRMVLETTRGSFTPAGTAHFDLVEIYEGTIGRERGREVIEEQVTWTEIFQPFLLGGLLFYVIFLVLPERPGRQAGMELEPTREEGARR